MSDMVKTLKAPGSKENEDFFSYIKFITDRNIEFGKVKDQTKGMSKSDSLKFMTEKTKVLNEAVQKFDVDFLAAHSSSFLADVLNLKTDKELKDIPKASNGRPDSVAQYKYYKAHFWDGVNFKDDRLLRTPFFADRIKRYYDRVIIQVPDTITVEIERIVAVDGRVQRCITESSRAYGVSFLGRGGHRSCRRRSSRRYRARQPRKLLFHFR